MSLCSKVYLAGPMTGLPQYNYPAFHDMAKRLRHRGFTVFNPAESFGGDTSLPYHEYMRLNIKELAGCKSMAVLPGWENSRGVALEIQVATALFMPVVEVHAGDGLEFTETPISDSRILYAGDPPKKQYESILDEAKALVHGSRQADYGHPKQNWERTAALMSVIVGVEVTPLNAILLAEAMKISRLCQGYKRDSAVDIAGYAEVLDIVCGE